MTYNNETVSWTGRSILRWYVFSARTIIHAQALPTHPVCTTSRSSIASSVVPRSSDRWLSPQGGQRTSDAFRTAEPKGAKVVPFRDSASFPAFFATANRRLPRRCPRTKRRCSSIRISPCPVLAPPAHFQRHRVHLCHSSSQVTCHEGLRLTHQRIIHGLQIT